MPQHLDEFCDEVRRSLAAFQLEYEDRHDQNKKNYPLVLPDNNIGLWFEFFTTYWHEEVV